MVSIHSFSILMMDRGPLMLFNKHNKYIATCLRSINEKYMRVCGPPMKSIYVFAVYNIWIFGVIYQMYLCRRLFLSIKIEAFSNKNVIEILHSHEPVIYMQRIYTSLWFTCSAFTRAYNLHAAHSHEPIIYIQHIHTRL